MLTKMPEEFLCPGCGQGCVVPVRVKSTGVRLFVCEECESTWFREEDIESARPMNFMDYMESQGGTGLWSELERLSKR
jgi:transcription elongation factor Elf1